MGEWTIAALLIEFFCILHNVGLDVNEISLVHIYSQSLYIPQNLEWNKYSLVQMQQYDNEFI